MASFKQFESRNGPLTVNLDNIAYVLLSMGAADRTSIVYFSENTSIAVYAAAAEFSPDVSVTETILVPRPIRRTRHSLKKRTTECLADAANVAD